LFSCTLNALLYYFAFDAIHYSHSQSGTSSPWGIGLS
jgi:hypothetical protein